MKIDVHSRLIYLLVMLMLLPLYTATAQKLVVSVEMGVSRTPDISGAWRYWHNNRHKPDSFLQSTGLRDIASPYYPAIGVYDDSDTMAIEYKCQLLKMCGIDAISFIAPIKTVDDPWFVQKQQAHLPYLQKYALKAFPRYQAGDTSQMSGIMELFNNTQQLYMDDRPVFSFFNVDMPRQLLDTWRQSRSSRGGVFLMRRLYTDSRRLSPDFDGVYDWVGDGKDKERDTTIYPYIWHYNARQIRNAYDYDIKKARSLLAAGAVKYYAEGIGPGFNDIKVNGWGKGPRYIERDHGKVYRYKWKKAVKNGFPMVVIPTWDDWCEGTTIAPAVEYGDLYLELTRRYVAAYKGIKQPKGNLMLPVWIYRLRKSSHNKQVREVTAQASALIAAGEFTAAEKLMAPWLRRFPVMAVKWWDKAISLSEFELQAAAEQGGNAATQSFTIRKTGVSPLHCDITADREWISLSSAKAVINDGDEVTVNVQYRSGDLSKGRHTGTITIADPAACNGKQEIQVSLTIN